MFGINLLDLMLLLRLLRNIMICQLFPSDLSSGDIDIPLMVLLRSPLVTVLLAASLILAVKSVREGGLRPAIKGRLLGGLFITWPAGAEVPDAASMQTPPS